jgi:hypothetical protein
VVLARGRAGGRGDEAGWWCLLVGRRRGRRRLSELFLAVERRISSNRAARRRRQSSSDSGYWPRAPSGIHDEDKAANANTPGLSNGKEERGTSGPEVPGRGRKGLSRRGYLGMCARARKKSDDAYLREHPHASTKKLSRKRVDGEGKEEIVRNDINLGARRAPVASDAWN